MFRARFLVVAIITVLALTIWVLMASAASSVTVTLNAQNGSGESGTAVLTDLGNGQTRVQVTLTGEPAGASQPEHVHQGTCTNLNPKPLYPLNNLVNGKSDTTLNVSLSTLTAGGLAINGHKSVQQITTYVFCGEIPTMVTTGGVQAQATATTGGVSAQATGTAAAPGTLPKTGGDPFPLFLVVLALGALAVGTGVAIRRTAH